MVDDLAFAFFESSGEPVIPSPCRYGSIIAGHACYCDNKAANIRKCPIWRNYGEDPAYWSNNGDWEEDENWDGGCKYFEPPQKGLAVKFDGKVFTKKTR